MLLLKGKVGSSLLDRSIWHQADAVSNSGGQTVWPTIVFEMQVSANLKPGQPDHFSELQNLVWWPSETRVFMDRKLISKYVLDCIFPAYFDAVRCAFNHFWQSALCSCCEQWRYV